MKIIGIIETMSNKKLSFVDYQIFLFKALLWVGVAWIGFISALGGFFYAPIIWAVFVFGGIGITRYALKNKMLARLSLELRIASTIFLLIVILFSFFSTPTVFSGRDQGAISEAAIRLSQNHTFEFSTPVSTEFFKIYGPGRALNFPGFYYTDQGDLTTQFPLVYIVWLALFYSLFGISGFIVANAILLCIFFFSFYLLIRLFLNAQSAIPTFLFTATAFIFMWFSKFTLSENMALPILWLSILALMLFLKSLRKLHYFVFLASAILLFFTRIEGIAFLAVSIIVISLNKGARKYIKEKPALRLWLPAIFFVAVFIVNIFRDFNFYREIAKALLPMFMVLQTQYLGALKDSEVPAFYIDKLFLIYGMLGFFIIGAIGICICAFKKEFYKLIPFFVVLPSFVYFLDSHITPGHPWMLRRFMFSLLPVGIFYSGLLLGKGLENWKNKKSIAIFSGIVVIILLAANLPAFSKYLTFSENKNLLAQTKLLSDNFSSNDLVLIDREATGDNWAMISGPMNFLYGKNAVYFFNTHDLAKLDLGKFDNVYLIAPNKQVPYYLTSDIGSQMTLKDTYKFTFSKLITEQDSSSEIISLPKKKEISINGGIFKITK